MSSHSLMVLSQSWRKRIEKCFNKKKRFCEKSYKINKCSYWDGTNFTEHSFFHTFFHIITLFFYVFSFSHGFISKVTKWDKKCLNKKKKRIFEKSYKINECSYWDGTNFTERNFFPFFHFYFSIFFSFSISTFYYAIYCYYTFFYLL